MNIVEFLEARIAEDELRANYYGPLAMGTARVLAECAAKRAILEQHKDWPILVEKKPEFTEATNDLNSMSYRVTQEMVWLTEREYVKRFGVEAPTTNMIRALAAIYRDHPDYQEAWAL